MIFERTTRSLSRITPVVFGNELFQTPFPRTGRIASSLSPEATPLVANLPLILGAFVQSPRLNAVPHRMVSIILPICDTGHSCDSASGYDFGNKDDASFILVAFSATNVEAQVDLVEIDVKRNGESSRIVLCDRIENRPGSGRLVPRTNPESYQRERTDSKDSVQPRSSTSRGLATRQ